MTLQGLPGPALLEGWRREAETMWRDLMSGDDEARWRFKWEHPRFRGRPVTEVDPATLEPPDAQLVVARQHGFETWEDLVGFTGVLQSDAGVARFEAAVEAVVSGDLTGLREALAAHPDLARQRSSRRHHATLLHYVGANGVEGERQKTPENAVEIARAILEAGAEPDAPADLYGHPCTTMIMLVSSSHPAEAGLQAELAGTLLDYGAALEGSGGGETPLMTALVFGYLDTAKALAARGARVGTLPAAAGLGRLEAAVRLLPEADAESRHIALALAAQHGQVAVLRLLLDAGEDPNRYNPAGHHPHTTPLHQAVWSRQAEAVETLVGRGARLDIKDRIYDGTPLDWALYRGCDEIAGYLRSRGSPAA